ncbi:MAG: SPFH domain-containing protein [Holophaga sp.]|nr:SPFH domain-containing protein [Holophaga sp.]
MFIFKPVDRGVIVSLRTVVLDVPSQDVITRDNVSLKVSAVVYFRLLDVKQAILGVENYFYAANKISQNPVAIQMRYLQTLGEIATEKNSTIIFPLPMELLKMMDRIAAPKEN